MQCPPLVEKYWTNLPNRTWENFCWTILRDDYYGKDAELGQGTKSSTSNAITLLVRGLSTINGVKPLILIDGVISPNVNYVYITPDEIESVTVLKDASTTAIYGIQGANGVISIKTKRGLVGKAKVNVSFDQSLQQTTRKPLL